MVTAAISTFWWCCFSLTRLDALLTTSQRSLVVASIVSTHKRATPTHNSHRRNEENENHHYGVTTTSSSTTFASNNQNGYYNAAHPNPNQYYPYSTWQVEKEASLLFVKPNGTAVPVGALDRSMIDKALFLLQKVSEIRRRPQVSVTMERVVYRLRQEQAAGNTLLNRWILAPAYISLITSWTKSGDISGLDRAQEIIQHMMDQYNPIGAPPKGQQEEELVVPANSSQTVATTAIVPWSNATADKNGYHHNNNTAAEHSQDQLEQEEWPPRETLNMMLWSYARSGHAEGPGKAVHFLSQWYQWYENGQCSFPPNSISYAAIMHAYANSLPPSAESDCQDDEEDLVFSALQHKNTNKDNNGKHHPSSLPTPSSTFSSQLESHNNRQIVLRLLLKMDQLSQDYPAVKPDLLCYHQYFIAIDISCRRHEISGRDGALLAEEHLERMLRHTNRELHPNSWSFQCVFRRWAFADLGESAERFENLLRLQERYHAAKGYTRDTCPLISSYNTLMKCYARSHLKDKVQRACTLFRRLGSPSNQHLPKPDSILYNSLMNLIAKSGLPRASYMVEALLKEMEQKQKDGDPSIRVDTTACNSLLVACFKSNRPDAFEKIEAMVAKMRRIALASYEEQKKANGTNGSSSQGGNDVPAPNRYTYDTYLKALAKAKRRDSIEKAESVLKEMRELHEKGFDDVNPDVYTFTNVLNCFATRGRHDSMQRAVALLDHLEEVHLKGQASMRPHHLTYNCCINAIAKSTTPGKAQVALDILRRMQSAAVAPLIETYNNVLNACAFSVHPKDRPKRVFEIAMKVFEEARNTVGANHITYLTMLRVINTQVSDKEKKWQWVREMVELCADDGQLTKPIMHGASLNVSPMQFQKLRLQVIDRATSLYTDDSIQLDTRGSKWQRTKR